jgi:hypothetical protein
MASTHDVKGEKNIEKMTRQWGNGLFVLGETMLSSIAC